MTTADVDNGGSVTPLKPGVLTTEFWVTVITSLVALLTATNVISPGFADKQKAAIDALAFLASAIAPLGYAISRGIAKRGHSQAVATVVAAHVAAGVPLPVTPAKRSRARRVVGDVGAGLVQLLLLLAGLVLLVVGVILIIVAATAPTHDVSVGGVIMALVGAVLLFFAGNSRGSLTL